MSTLNEIFLNKKQLGKYIIIYRVQRIDNGRALERK